MRFRPRVAYIDGIRDFCSFFCRTTFPDSTVAVRVQLVIQEMLENAIKYSAVEKGCDVELEVRLEPENQQLVIVVLNYATAEAVNILRDEIATISKMEPEEAYFFSMQRAKRGAVGVNRMGIARMRCDGQVDLSVSLTDDGRIRVEARGKT